MKKLTALVLALVLVLSVAAVASAEETGSIYYLNFKPEVAEAWEELAAAYTEETGVQMTVITAASGTYEDTLKSEIAKTEAPTLFQVNGPVGLNTWKDYCYDMSGSAFYGELTNDAFALKDGDAVLAIAYLTETYGLITNTALLEKAGYTVDDITSFETLKAVAEDITARKDELGFSAFTSAGMDSSSDWRFKTHLANMPIYYEYLDDGISSTDAIKGTYLDNYKAMWDLYINNATCEPTTLADTMGFDIPFKAAKESTNLFKKVAAEYVANGKTPVTWNFTTMPSETWKDGVGAALTDYAQGTGEWDAVVTAFVDGWATEYAAANG